VNKKALVEKIFKSIVEDLKRDQSGNYTDSSLDSAIDLKFTEVSKTVDQPPAGQQPQPGPDGQSQDQNRDFKDQENAKKIGAEFTNFINNFENLVDLKGLLVKRILNQVNQNYGKDFAKKVGDYFNSQNLNIKDKEEPQAPNAVGAGPGGGGGGG
jgi:hypothetical protein